MEQNDIVIPQDKVQEFFFLNETEEQEEYGASGDHKHAAELTQKIMQEKGSINKVSHLIWSVWQPFSF